MATDVVQKSFWRLRVYDLLCQEISLSGDYHPAGRGIPVYPFLYRLPFSAVEGFIGAAFGTALFASGGRRVRLLFLGSGL